MIGPGIACCLSGLPMFCLRVCFDLALVGIYLGLLRFGVLAVRIDLLFGLGVWGGAKVGFCARLCACYKFRNVE